MTLRLGIILCRGGWGLLFILMAVGYWLTAFLGVDFMSKTLIIAEKPSMAEDIARALGGLRKRTGYFEGEDYLLSWAVGHLVGLSDPEEYRPEWKRWSARQLPIIPAQFSLKPLAKTKSQFELINKLCQRPDVDRLVNACDAGREGELIFRYIMAASGCQKPFSRLWVSSLTGQAIRQGFQQLRQQAEMESLYQAAQCRAQSDWLVGINATRAVTVRQKSKERTVFSLGRVQTPTLALLVGREDEILAFEPRDYWELKAQFGSSSGSYHGKWFKGEENRLWQANEAETIAAKVRGQSGHVVSYRYQIKEESAPLLFDLTSLQREANRRYSFSAAKTLKLAQGLYEEKKLITYPRTDSRFLTPDLIPTFPARIEAVGRRGVLADAVNELLSWPKLPISGRVINKAKVRDHHALIPTENPVQWDNLGRDERKIYELIVRAFLASFYPPAKWGHAEAVTEVLGETFKSQGKQLLEKGWRCVQDQKERDEDLLPTLTAGMEVLLKQCEVVQDITKAPARYTEGTLLSAMESAGKLLQDEELQDAMKESGLGTPATRASIIERLKGVEYIEAVGKELKPTAKGMALIHGLPVDALKSPEMTGQWEYKLRQVEEGALPAQRFMTEMTFFISDMVGRCLQGERLEIAGEERQLHAAPSNDWGRCPLCGGAIRENAKAYGCENWRATPPCPFAIWKTIAKKKLTESQVRALLTKGKTSLIKGFVSSKGSKFPAYLKLQEGKVVFEFAAAKAKKTKKDE